MLTARLPLPDTFIKGRANTVECPMYDTALITPSSATVSIFDSSGKVILASTAATITAGVPTYTTTSTLFDNYPYQDDCVVSWNITIAGKTHQPRNMAHIAKYDLFPVISDQDLFTKSRQLESFISDSLPNYESYRKEAWVELYLRLLEQGNRPQLIMTSQSLRMAHLNLTLAIIYQDFSTRLEEAHVETAQRFRDAYEQAFDRITFKYDSNEDGIADGIKQSATASYWLSGMKRR